MPMTAFARNDFRGLFREPLLIGMLLAPVLWTLMVRLPMPAVTTLMADRYGIDLADYHALIMTGFLLLTAPIVVGGLVGLMVLDERDSGTLLALRVSPVPLSEYIRYRAGIAVGLTCLCVVGTTLGSGLLPFALVPATFAAAISAGSCALLIALVLIAFAGNKVEGVALIRALGIVVAGLPLVPYFLGTAWQPLFWPIPTYWPAKAFWVAFAGGPVWPYVLVGVGYPLLLAWPLYRRFRYGSIVRREASAS
ncbi:ABC transporter permease [Parasphingorhabdus pacifica]